MKKPMLDSNQNSESEFDRLRIFNFIMGIFHFAQGVLMVLLSKDYTETLTTSFINIVGTSENFRFVSQTQEFVTFKLGPAVALFLFISAMAHFLLTLPGIFEWYVKNLKKGANYARWYEYSISSSVMIVIIAILVGMYDAPSLLLLVWFKCLYDFLWLDDGTSQSNNF
ncbi:MAG: hypothetical protein KatS3mg085_274 [Candidatus Dojkabacteria bacterium]|nr:MAG: hypothetical protein KatS3mg085_274 [Candidatus Dojkabacteria bacterium]